VALKDKKEDDKEYEEFTVDKEKWVAIIVKPYFDTTLPTNMNVMTYLGYYGGDGSAGNSYKAKEWTNPASYVPYTFKKKQFFTMYSLTNFEVTKQVYIIRHGDGVTYSKVQITGFEMLSSPAKDVYQITWQILQSF
jgi:hypothetical protein